MILLKLRKLIAKESLARMRRRVHSSLKSESNAMIYRNVFYQGIEGYLREDIYHVGNR